MFIAPFVLQVHTCGLIVYICCLDFDRGGTVAPCALTLSLTLFCLLFGFLGARYKKTKRATRARARGRARRSCRFTPHAGNHRSSSRSQDNRTIVHAAVGVLHGISYRAYPLHKTLLSLAKTNRLPFYLMCPFEVRFVYSEDFSPVSIQYRGIIKSEKSLFV